MITAKEALEKTKEVHKQQTKQLLLITEHAIDQAAKEGIRSVSVPLPVPEVGEFLGLQLRSLGYGVSIYVKEIRVFW